MLRRLSRIEMVARSPDRLAAFYEAAFGFVRCHRFGGILGNSVELLLGQQEIALLGVRPYGRPYPADVPGWNPLFQHVAIVTNDMAAAYARLSTVADWTPISSSGPQQLPAASGGVTAFKFRDPEGHPLELIAFAPDSVPAQWRTGSKEGFLGIDHSAISVTTTQKSITFYERLGLKRGGGSLNIGPEQSCLDDVKNAVVEVTALKPFQATPHVELLCYRGDFDRHVPPQLFSDATATRLVFAVEGHDAFNLICSRNSESIVEGSMRAEGTMRHLLMRDPDGHLICLELATD